MKIHIAQLNYKIGDFAQNYAKIVNIIQQAGKDHDLICFSELSLSGYYPYDLIENPDFIKTQNIYFEKLVKLSKNFTAAILIGFIDLSKYKGKKFHNSLAIIQQGQVIYKYHKKLLPVYNIFDESRHFAPGKIPGVFDFKDLRLGFLICEDGWAGSEPYIYHLNPAELLIASRVDIIICINASPANLGKICERLNRFSNISKKAHSPLIFINQVGANDDIVFDGTSFVLDKNANQKGHLKLFEEQSASIDIIKNQNIVLDNNFINQELIINENQFIHDLLKLGLKDYLTKCGFTKVVVGVSGGIDSALTLALAVSILGPKNVTAIFMPSKYTSEQSKIDATKLTSNLGLKLITIDIQSEVDVALDQFSKNFKQTANDITKQNIQARIRGRILMEYSNQTGALVLATGNKSELSVGYATLYGDLTGGLSLIGDLYKTEVFEQVKYHNQTHPDLKIPDSMLTKEPSAELSENQKDTDNLPDYPILDAILKLYIEGDLLSNQQRSECQRILTNTSEDLINKVHNMVNNAEFKRRQAPPIIRLQRRAFGLGRQLPIAAVYPIRETKL